MRKAVREHREMLRRAHRERAAEIRARLEEFRQVPRDGLAYELIYCLLTPQSSARNAGAVVEKLKAAKFVSAPFDTEHLLRNRDHYIRFHRTKSRRLNTILQILPEVDALLHSGGTSQQHRAWLVQHVDGFGMKEATHFLRNIGRNDGLAILDRHILRHLVYSGVLEEIPASMSMNLYLSIERRFKRFSRAMKIPIDELDLLFWSLQTGEILK